MCDADVYWHAFVISQILLKKGNFKIFKVKLYSIHFFFNRAISTSKSHIALENSDLFAGNVQIFSFQNDQNLVFLTTKLEVSNILIPEITEV